MTPLLHLPTRRATRHLARGLAAALQPGDLVLLEGGLGSGKTFLTRAIARCKGLPTELPVLSPTFPLIRSLPTQPPIEHADLYRLQDGEGVHELGLFEYRQQGAILIVEWGQRFEPELGGDALTLQLEQEPRQVRLASSGPRSVALLQALLESATPELRDGPRPR